MGYKLIWLGLFVIVMILFAFAWSPRKKKIIFFGDSITQAGTQLKGYISMLALKMREEGLDADFELAGSGISGNKVYDLYLRLEEDILARSPDMVVIYIGVNDIWHKRLLGTGTDYDKFGKFYEAIVSRLKAADIKVIVCTPAVIGERTDNSNEMDGDLNLYSAWIKNFAEKNGLGLVNLRRSFITHNLEYNPENHDKGILTTDRVHLNDAGNALVAGEMLKAIKFMYKK